MWLSSFQHRVVNHLLNGCHKHTRSQQRSYFSFIRTARSGYNTTANAFSRCKKHLKLIPFFPRNKVKSSFALLVWSLAYFVIVPHSCSFFHKLEIVAPAQRQQSLRKNRTISSTAGRDLQHGLRECPKLCPPWLDWRSIEVPRPGCEAQIQEIVLCCRSTACANTLSMLCAQY